jgi:hypothetical protein
MYRPARRGVLDAAVPAQPMERNSPVSLFMDMHTLPGPVTSEEVAKAHAADLATQGDDVTYLRYWVDEGEGKIFCLVEAPSAEAAAAVHREAHGLVADEIFPVIEGE